MADENEQQGGVADGGERGVHLSQRTNPPRTSDAVHPKGSALDRCPVCPDCNGTGRKGDGPCPWGCTNEAKPESLANFRRAISMPLRTDAEENRTDYPRQPLNRIVGQWISEEGCVADHTPRTNEAKRQPCEHDLRDRVTICNMCRMLSEEERIAKKLGERTDYAPNANEGCNCSDVSCPDKSEEQRTKMLADRTKGWLTIDQIREECARQLRSAALAFEDIANRVRRLSEQRALTGIHDLEEHEEIIMVAEDGLTLATRAAREVERARGKWRS